MYCHFIDAAVGCNALVILPFYLRYCHCVDVAVEYDAHVLMCSRIITSYHSVILPEMFRRFDDAAVEYDALVILPFYLRYSVILLM